MQSDIATIAFNSYNQSKSWLLLFECLLQFKISTKIKPIFRHCGTAFGHWIDLSAVSYRTSAFRNTKQIIKKYFVLSFCSMLPASTVAAQKFILSLPKQCIMSSMLLIPKLYYLSAQRLCMPLIFTRTTSHFHICPNINCNSMSANYSTDSLPTVRAL